MLDPRVLGSQSVMGGQDKSSGKPHEIADADVLGDMRKQWLAAEEQPVQQRPAVRRRRLKAAAEVVASEWRLMLGSLRSAAHELYGAVTSRRDRDPGERSGYSPAALLVVLLVVVVAGGAVAYVAAVQFISQAPDMAVAAAPAEQTHAAAARPAEPKQVEQTAALNENGSRGLGFPPAPVTDYARPAPLVAIVAKHTPDVANSAPVNASAKVLGSSVEGVDDLARQMQRNHVEQQWQSAGRTGAAPQPGGRAALYAPPRILPQEPRSAPAATAFYVADTNVSSPIARVVPGSSEAAFTSSSASTVPQPKRSLTPGEADRATIANGGAVEYRVRHFHRGTGAFHPVTIRVTGTTVEFIPDGRCELGRFTVPPVSVMAANGGPGLLNLAVMRSDAGQTQLTVANATGRGAQPSLRRLQYVLTSAQMTAEVRK